MKTSLVLVTCPAEDAERIARALVENRHAACVNIIPRIRSIYRWQGRIDTAEESLLLIKLPGTGFEALRDAVCALHPYELPEVIEVDVDRGHGPYLDWVTTACASP